jgi:hypothetical protein
VSAPRPTPEQVRRLADATGELIAEFQRLAEAVERCLAAIERLRPLLERRDRHGRLVDDGGLCLCSLNGWDCAVCREAER